MTQRKHFPIYMDWEQSIKKFSVAEKALFLDKLFEFYNKETPTEIPDEMIRLDIFWTTISRFINENEEKWITATKNRQAGIKKALKANPKIPNTRLPEIDIPNNRSSNVNVNVNVKDNVNDKIKGNVNEGAPTPHPTPSPDSPEFRLLSLKEKERIMDLEFNTV